MDMSASAMALTTPEKITVNRSEFREHMSTFLSKTIGYTVVVVTTPGDGEEKCVVDNKYFEELLKKLRAAVETLEITSDPKLYRKLLKAAETLDEDLALEKLHSFEEAFEGE